MERPATIVDVAKRAGVAISSASSALNGRPGVSDATRTRVREAADELGFVPSLRGRSLSSKRAYAVGLIVSRDADVFEEDPFFGGFLAGIESVLGARGYALVLQMSTTVEENTERYRRMALDRRVDGVFINEITIDDPRIPLLRDRHDLLRPLRHRLLRRVAAVPGVRTRSDQRHGRLVLGVRKAATASVLPGTA